MHRILLMSTAVLGLALAAGPALAAAPPPVDQGDIALGSAKAPVTVIEYASLTCPHCARWETDIYPQVKEKLIDTGKIRYVFRDYPLDGIALKAAQLARCEPSEYIGFIQTLFQQQMSWIRQDDPVVALTKLARLGGLSEEKAQACLNDTKLQDSIVASRQRGTEAGVDSTPTFFFNGKAHAGELDFEAFAKLVQEAGS